MTKMKAESRVVRVLALAAVLAGGNVLAADNAVAPPAPVAQTGLKVSYTPGDDGTYQAGVPWPNPRFTVDGDCVTDNLTGLMWAKNFGKPMPWTDALAYCKQLDLSGHKDWRLPNMRELQSLNDWSVGTTSLLPKEHPFTGLPVLATWTSTTYAPDTNCPTFVLNNCYWSHEPRTKEFNVLPVRGGVAKDGKIITKGIAPVARTGQTKSYAPGDDGDLQMGVAWPTPRFVVDKTGDCVTDNLTGLMWAKNANISVNLITGFEAIDICEKLELGGYDDWRLPNIKELQSLMDYSMQTLPKEPFVNTQGGLGYWSGTLTSPAQPPYSVWGVNGEGYVTGNTMDGSRYKHYVWPVRGGVLAPVKPAQPKEPEKKQGTAE